MNVWFVNVLVLQRICEYDKRLRKNRTLSKNIHCANLMGKTKFSHHSKFQNRIRETRKNRSEEMKLWPGHEHSRSIGNIAHEKAFQQNCRRKELLNLWTTIINERNLSFLKYFRLHSLRSNLVHNLLPVARFIEPHQCTGLHNTRISLYLFYSVFSNLF